MTFKTIKTVQHLWITSHDVKICLSEVEIKQTVIINTSDKIFVAQSGDVL